MNHSRKVTGVSRSESTLLNKRHTVSALANSYSEYQWLTSRSTNKLMTPTCVFPAIHSVIARRPRMVCPPGPRNIGAAVQAQSSHQGSLFAMAPTIIPTRSSKSSSLSHPLAVSLF